MTWKTFGWYVLIGVTAFTVYNYVAVPAIDYVTGMATGKAGK